MSDRTLDDDTDDITALLDGDFSGLTDLEELYLSLHQLSDLPDGIFSGLTSLETLGLDYNELSDLRSGVFDDLTNLERLSLDNNQLSDLPDGIFSGITSLTTLSLDNNPGAPFRLILTSEIVSDTSFQVVVSARRPVSNEGYRDLNRGNFFR